MCNKIILFFILLLLPAFKTFAQSGFEIRGGVGFVDLVHIGLKYNAKISPGLNIGLYDPFVKHKTGLFVIEPCAYYHYSLKDDSSERKPWYVKNGLAWLNLRPNEKYLFFTVRFGGEIYLVDHIGISIDVGLNIELWTSFKTELINSPPALPGFGMCLFFKL